MNTVNGRGRMSLSTALFLAGGAVVVYIAIKVVPVYVNESMIQNVFEEEAPTITQQSASDIFGEISKKLKDMNSPLDPRLVRVDVDNTSITISAQYTETVEFLGGYKKSFTFSPRVVSPLRRAQ